MEFTLILLEKLEPAFLKLIIVLPTVWLGYKFGLMEYFKRREHEQIIKRYLDQGVDLLSANIDNAIGIFRENWTQSLRMIKEFRDTWRFGEMHGNVRFRDSLIEQKFIKYEPKSFSQIPYYKLRSLVGNDIFWEAGQLLFFHIGRSYSFFEDDFKNALRLFKEKHERKFDSQIGNKEAEKIYKVYMEEFKKLNEKTEKFGSVLRELQNIALILETEYMTYKDLEDFKNRENVKKFINRLKQDLKEEMNQEDYNDTNV